MAWDFSTDAEWAGQLAWVEEFVRQECEPIDLIVDESHDLNDPVRQALIPPLQQIVKQRGLWATHLAPHLGGPGYGQVKLALLNEILGRSECAGRSSSVPRRPTRGTARSSPTARPN